MATDVEKELERASQLRGFRFGLHDFLAGLRGAAALKKLNDHSEAGYLKKGLLDRKTKELLMIIGIVAQKGSVSHIRAHMHAANKAGATPDEIMEALDLMGGHIGHVAKLGGLEAWRITFRPDLPAIDQVTDLR